MSNHRNLPLRGQTLPELGGRSVDGRDLRISEFRGRRNLVLIFAGTMPNGLRDLFPALSVRYREFQDENSEIIVMVPGGSDEAISIQREFNLSFPMLADNQSANHRAFGAMETGAKLLAAICIADRYGEIYSVLKCVENECPTVDEILEWVRFIEIQCPEYGVSEWPRS